MTFSLQSSELAMNVHAIWQYLAQQTCLELQLGASTQRQRARDSGRSRDRRVCIGGSFLCDILTTSDSRIGAAIAIDAREGLLPWQSAGWRSFTPCGRC
jgi:hypothetical protein